MNTKQNLEKAEWLLTNWKKETTYPESDRMDVLVTAEDLRSAVTTLHEAKWGYLSAITGLDLGVESGQLEALYHFCNGPAITSLKVHVPRVGDASLPTIEDIIPSATFFERELSETVGFQITGAKSMDRLFISDDWPEGVYPLRADFKIEQAAPVEGRYVDEIPEEGVVRGNTFVVPIGPQHPALKEPGHFEFTVDGEIVTAARMRLGYAHRGIEKAAESRNWIQNLYLFERVCGICSHVHTMAYAAGVEKLAQVEVPMRAHAIRQIVAGLERIHSHLLWLGVAAHEAGFDTLFMYSWRDRETVMNLLEQITGNRVNYSANVLGGVKCDIGLEQAKVIKEGLDFLEVRIRHYLEVVTTDTMFLNRTRGVGTITREEAELFGLLGPTARASGLVRDVRVEAPRGELLYYIKSGGGESPLRVHVRTPSLCNWVSVLEKAVGRQLADVPMLIAGMDPCFSCNDRVVTVKHSDGQKTWSWKQLREYGIEYYKR